MIDRNPNIVDVSETAATLAKSFATRAVANDESDKFIEDNYTDLKEVELISAGVPTELCGGGANVRDLCEMLRIIGSGSL